MSVDTQTQPSTADHSDMIHVVGMYKCGTSWLLHMLAAHPQVVGWREFDALRAVYAPRRSLLTLPLAAADYLYPRPGSPAWMRRREASSLRPSQAIFREMFAGRGWLPVMGLDKQQLADSLDPQDLPHFLQQVLSLGRYRLRPSDAALLNPADYTETLGLQNFREGDLLCLMQAVRDSNQPQKIPTVFFESLRSQVQPGTRIATKAADQLLHLSDLKQASPGSRTIAIVRDGRDAAISAQHFEALMRKREAPWQTQGGGYFRRLLGWSMRAAKLAEHARRNDVTVLRYEDLRADFSGTCRALFMALGLDATAQILAQIEITTDFATVTQGRNSGESAEHEIRKGSTGEWKETLSASQAALAWHLAGGSLAALGYTRDGKLTPSSLALSA